MSAARIIAWLLLATLFLAVPARADETYGLCSGCAANITGPDGVCRQVINYNPYELAVMTYNVSEWQNFYNAGQGGVSIGACPALDCPGTPWGTVSNGASVTAYAYPSGTSCNSACGATQTRTCTNGVLSGSYGYTSCSYSSCSGTCSSGYCYYTSYGGGDSCNDVCADSVYAPGSCNLAGTQHISYVSGGMTECQNIIVDMWGPWIDCNGPVGWGNECAQNSSPTISQGTGWTGSGCFYAGSQIYDYNQDQWDIWYNYVDDNSTATCEATSPYNWVYRVCACGG